MTSDLEFCNSCGVVLARGMMRVKTLTGYDCRECAQRRSALNVRHSDSQTKSRDVSDGRTRQGSGALDKCTDGRAAEARRGLSKQLVWRLALTAALLLAVPALGGVVIVAIALLRARALRSELGPAGVRSTSFLTWCGVTIITVHVAGVLVGGSMWAVPLLGMSGETKLWPKKMLVVLPDRILDDYHSNVVVASKRYGDSDCYIWAKTDGLSEDAESGLLVARAVVGRGESFLRAASQIVFRFEARALGVERLRRGVPAMIRGTVASFENAVAPCLVIDGCEVLEATDFVREFTGKHVQVSGFARAVSFYRNIEENCFVWIYDLGVIELMGGTFSVSVDAKKPSKHELGLYDGKLAWVTTRAVFEAADERSFSKLCDVMSYKLSPYFSGRTGWRLRDCESNLSD